MRTDRHQDDMTGPPLDALRALWQDVLGVAAVADDDNFFALGGDSLMAMALAGRAAAAGIDMPTSAVLRHPVLRDLAEAYRTD
jgi:aryl carrier-like protein